jgi:diguanylate cyclase (GGDEF)-like protein
MDTHVLIVDDNAEIRESMHDYLEMTGFNPSTAYSAEEALDLIAENEFHVVITDIKLPGMSGLELVDFIKKKYNIDIIVMTGFSRDYSYEEAIRRGANDFVFKPVRLEELLLRLKRVMRERRLSRDRDRMLKKLQRLAITDDLTKLYNVRYFYNQLEVEVDRSSRYNHPLSLLLMDIDHFKHFNDTYGHLEGDKVLVRFGVLIKSCLRAMDSAYRYGGEEFTIILPETKGDEALNVAERIRKVTEAERMTPQKEKLISITVSVGVTQYIINDTVASLIQRADKAMYMSKQSGRNRVSSLFENVSV